MDWNAILPLLNTAGPWVLAIVIGIVAVQSLRRPAVPAPAAESLGGVSRQRREVPLTDADKLVTLHENCTAAMREKCDEHAAEAAKLRAALPSLSDRQRS